MLELDPDAVVWSVPPEARQERPLLVLMHGRGSDEHDLATLASALPAAFVTASVRAPLAEGPGWSWFEAGVQAPGIVSLDAADQASDAVLAWLSGLGWVPSTVGTMGFSQGGVMAIHLMRRNPHRFAFAVNLAGTVAGGEHLSDAVLAATRPPAFWGRGTEDPLFTSENVHHAESWLMRHTSLTTGLYPGLGHSISPEELRDVVSFLQARLADPPR